MEKVNCYCDPICEFCKSFKSNDGKYTGKCLKTGKDGEGLDNACKDFECPKCGKKYDDFIPKPEHKLSQKFIAHNLPEVRIGANITAADAYNLNSLYPLNRGTIVWVRRIEGDNYIVTLKYGNMSLAVPFATLDQFIK